MDPLKLCDTVTWKSNIKNQSDTRNEWAVWAERITERFWCSVSCFGEHYQVTHALPEGKYAITRLTHGTIPSPNPYRWLDRLLCLLIIPPLIMLIAKACFRHSKRLSLNSNVPTTSMPPPLFIPPATQIPERPPVANSEELEKIKADETEVAQLELACRVSLADAIRWGSIDQINKITQPLSKGPNTYLLGVLSSMISQAPNLNVFCHLIGLIESYPDCQKAVFFSLIHLENPGKQLPYLEALVGLYPALTRSIEKGWTALHYAYLKGNEGVIKLLESRDPDLTNVSSTEPHLFTFNRRVHARRSNQKWSRLPGSDSDWRYEFPAKITPAQLRQEFCDIHARDALVHFTFSKRKYENLDYCPWRDQDVAKNPVIICNYLDPLFLNEIDSKGFSLLHYTNLLSNSEPFYKALIAKGANTEIRSTSSFLNTDEEGFPKTIPSGKTSEELRIAFWQEAALIALTKRFDQVTSHSLTSHFSTGTLNIFRYSYQITFQNLDEALSKIDVNIIDSTGLRLIDYAILFDDQPLIEALRRHGAQEQAVPICVYELEEEDGSHRVPLLQGTFTPAQFKERFIPIYLTLTFMRCLEQFNGQLFVNHLQHSLLSLLWQHLKIPTNINTPESLLNSLTEINPQCATKHRKIQTLLSKAIYILKFEILSLDRRETLRGNTRRDFACAVAQALVKKGADLFEVFESFNLYSLFKSIPEERLRPGEKALATQMDDLIKTQLSSTIQSGTLPSALGQIVLEYFGVPQKQKKVDIHELD